MLAPYSRQNVARQPVAARRREKREFRTATMAARVGAERGNVTRDEIAELP